MKITNKIAAALLGLGIAHQASADPVVYLTGSSAFRATTYASLNDNSGPVNGGVFDAGTMTRATYGSGSASGSSYMIFHGNISGSGVYINCAWSGSEAGIASACNVSLNNVDRNGNTIALAGSPETWLNATNPIILAAIAAGSVISTNPSSASGLYEASSHGADLSQADTSQSVSWTPRVPSTTTDLHDYGVEGIVTFTITKNNQIGNSGSGIPTGASNEWAHVSNVNLDQMCTLLSGGVLPAGFFTGNAADSDFTVYAVGRNLGSGTRMNMLSDSTYGGKKAVQQFSIGYGVNEPATTSLVLTNEGNGGYESGGGVAKALGITGSCQQADPFNGGTGWFALGYLGPSDALNTANNGGEPTNCWVTVGGFPSNNGTIENGQWWLWGHEHLYGKFGISGIQNTVGGLLEAGVIKYIQINNYGATAGGHDPAIQNSLMNVVKSSDVDFPHY